MSYWSEEGYGFPVTNVQKVAKVLLEEEPNDEIRELLLIAQKPDQREYQCIADMFEIFDEPASWVLADHYNHKYGFGFGLLEGHYANNHLNDEYLGFRTLYPWEAKYENNLPNKKRADEILWEIADELGFDGKFDYFSLEYCG